MNTEQEILSIINNGDLTLDNAKKVAEYIFPQLNNLTLPMQGMVINSLFIEEAEFTANPEDPKRNVVTYSYRWHMGEIAKTIEGFENRNKWEINRRDSYERTLSYACKLLWMHNDWGVEK